MTTARCGCAVLLPLLRPRTQNETWTHDCLDDMLIAIFRGATTRCVLIRLPYTSLYKGNVIDNARSERAPPRTVALRLNVRVRTSAPKKQNKKDTIQSACTVRPRPHCASFCVSSFMWQELVSARCRFTLFAIRSCFIDDLFAYRYSPGTVPVMNRKTRNQGNEVRYLYR